MDEQNNSEKLLNAAGDKINQAIESIFKLSTGALALSITFRNSLTECHPKYLWLLSISWILLGLVPISYVFFRFNEAQEDLFWKHMYDEAGKSFAEKKEVKPMDKFPAELIRHQLAKDICYYTLLGGFVLGVITFLLFAILNNMAGANHALQ